MKIKIVITTIILLLVVSSLSPVRFKYEMVVVKNPPTNWQQVIKGDDEVIIRNYVLKIVERKRVTVTAYSSTVDQTDSTPFITASNTRVRDGIVACNDYEFGTRILIPNLFGHNRILVVEDRMNRRYTNKNRLDIWFKTRKVAKKFGIEELEIIVLAN